MRHDLPIDEFEPPTVIELIVVGASSEVEGHVASPNVECRTPGPHGACQARVNCLSGQIRVIFLKGVVLLLMQYVATF
jgi:hypothetical protein